MCRGHAAALPMADDGAAAGRASRLRCPDPFTTARSPPWSNRSVSDLTTLANIGPAMARDLARLGVSSVADLVGRDPVELYERWAPSTAAATIPVCSTRS